MAKKIELKTKQNKQSVAAFLNSIENEEKRKDSKTILKIMREITGQKPVMWGPSIVGFGTYEYKRSNGDYGTFMRTAFSPRKDTLTLYIMPGYDLGGPLFDKLGPHKTGKSCLYIKKLENIHIPTLKKIIKEGWQKMAKMYPEKKK